MSAIDNDSLLGGDKEPQVFMDINDNVQPLDGHCFQDKMRKKDADRFLNFDMWKFSVLSLSPNSPNSNASPKVDDESPLLDQAQMNRRATGRTALFIRRRSFRCPAISISTIPQTTIPIISTPCPTR